MVGKRNILKTEINEARRVKIRTEKMEWEENPQKPLSLEMKVQEWNAVMEDRQRAAGQRGCSWSNLQITGARPAERSSGLQVPV